MQHCEGQNILKKCLRKQHKKEEHTRTAFYRDPYRFVKDLTVKDKTGTPKVPIKELEEHNDPVDEGAALLRRELNICREMVIRMRT